MFGPVWVNVYNKSFYINGIRWLESHVNVVWFFQGGHSQVPVVEAIEQQSRYENEEGLPASLVKEDGTRVCGERSGVERGKLASKRFVCTQLFYSALLICVLLPPAEWISLMFYQLFEKWGEAVWNTSEGWSRANLKGSSVSSPSLCVLPSSSSWSQRGLNWCPPHFSSSCYLHVTLIQIHLKSEKSGARQLLSHAQSSVSWVLQPHSIPVFALTWFCNTMTFLGCTV